MTWPCIMHGTITTKGMIERLAAIASEHVVPGGLLGETELIRVSDHAQDVIDGFILEACGERAVPDPLVPEVDADPEDPLQLGCHIDHRCLFEMDDAISPDLSG